jgi:hypothetical protein
MEPKKTPSKRAPRVASPGTKRLVITGVLGVTDDFGRIRLILCDTKPDGSFDDSWKVLRKEAPNGPYKLEDGLVRAGEDRGVVHIVVPPTHRAHWLDVAADLRGQWVRVEALLRPFNMVLGDGSRSAGTSLDLAALEALGQG